MHELAAAEGDPHVRRTAADGLEEHQVPGLTSSRSIFASLVVLLPHLSREAVPCCANTHCTKPLQSNPRDGSLPPFRYGVPRSARAVAISSAGASGVRGSRASGRAGLLAPGKGCGLGTAPPLAHPATMADASTDATSPGRESSSSCQCIVVTRCVT